MTEKDDDPHATEPVKGDLAERIQAAKEASKASKKGSGLAQKYNAASLAWRMTIELIVGTLIGLGMGWGLDSLFGTKPLFLIVFCLFGVAAGLNVVIQTSKEANKTRTGEDGEDRRS